VQGNPKRRVSSKPALNHLLQDDKTDPPQYYQRGNGEINENVVLEAHEAIGKEGEPGVAEGRYGMEEGEIEGSYWRKLTAPSHKEKSRTDEFDNRGIEKNGFQEHGDIPYGRLGEGILDDSPVPKADGPPHEEVKEDGEGHDSQSPDLDQDQNDHLSELGIKASRIHHDQPRYAYRGGGCEKGVNERGRFSPCSIGKAEQECSDEDHDEKAEDEGSLGA